MQTIIENDVLTILKDRLSKFTYDIVDEDLTAHSTAYLRYDSANTNWVSSPVPKIRLVDIEGREQFLAPSLYTITASDGYITLTTAKDNTDIIRADYSFFPFTDAQLLSIIQSAYKQIETLIFKQIGLSGYSGVSGYSGASGYSGKYFWNTYQEVIFKKCYSIAMREMQFPTIKYFQMSIGGRSISKEAQVTMISTMIENIEKELLPEINALRYFDKTTVIT